MNLKSLSQNKHFPTFCFWLLGLIWGSNFLYMKVATQYITTTQVVFSRVVLALIPVVLYAMSQNALQKSHLKHWYHFIVMALLATVLYYYYFVQGTHLLYSGIAGAISGSAPIFTFILGAFFLKEDSVTVKKIVGLLLGIAGIAILAKPSDATFSATTWLGIGYMILGSISFGASFIYAKKFIMPLNIPSSALASYQLVGASAMLLAMTDFTGITQISQDTNALLGLVIGLGFLGTGLSFLIYYYIIEKMGAVKASSVAYIPPIVALIIGGVWAGEPIGMIDIVGTVMVLVGVYFLKR